MSFSVSLSAVVKSLIFFFFFWLATRALLIMAVHFIALSPGDDGGAGIAFLVLCVQSCLQVGILNRPFETKLSLTFDPSFSSSSTATRTARRGAFQKPRQRIAGGFSGCPSLSNSLLAPPQVDGKNKSLFSTACLRSLTLFADVSCSLLHLKDIDTRIPRDVRDEMMGDPACSPSSDETDMTSLICRIKIAQLSERISDEAFG